MAELKRHGVNVAEEESAVVITAATEDTYETISRALVESKAPLRRMGPKRHALSEIFEPEAIAAQAQAVSGGAE
jgi:hypothetical protein